MTNHYLINLILKRIIWLKLFSGDELMNDAWNIEIESSSTQGGTNFKQTDPDMFCMHYKPPPPHTHWLGWFSFVLIIPLKWRIKQNFNNAFLLYFIFQNPENRILYRLTDTKTFFSIDPNTGLITINKPLSMDAQKQKQYQVRYSLLS